MTDAIDDALTRLGAMTGLALDRFRFSREGISADGGRLAGVAAGRGLLLGLSKTITSATATLLPEESAGPLVRRLGRWTQENPDPWRAAVREFESRNIVLTVSVNHEILDDPADTPEGLWRSFAIEAWTRTGAYSPKEVAQSLVLVAAPALALAVNGIFDQDDRPLAQDHEALPEGASLTVSVNRYERNPLNRLRCINHYGAACWVCGLDFGELYGPSAAGYIQVHHRVPVSMMGGTYQVDPIRDLVPLCSNCHSVAHRRKPPYEPSELRTLLGLPPKKPALPTISFRPREVDLVPTSNSYTFELDDTYTLTSSDSSLAGDEIGTAGDAAL